MKNVKNFTLAALALSLCAAAHADNAILARVDPLVGNIISGGVDNLRTVDGSSMVYRSVLPFMSWQLLCGVHVPISQIHSMRVAIRARRSLLGSVTLFAFDNVTHSWSNRGAQIFGTVFGSRSWVFPPAIANHFTASGGATRLKFVSPSGTMYTDWVSVTVNE
jgi:hypothetical protein